MTAPFGPFTGVKPMSELKVTLIGALLTAIGPLSLALYTPAMPALVDYFGSTNPVVQLTITLYFAGFAVTQLICGPLSDGLGRRPVILGFTLIYVLASVTILLTTSIEVMLAGRFLQGIGAAAGVAIARAIVRDVFADARAIKIMNLMGLFIAIAPAVAPTIGGATLEIASWQALFAMMAGIGVLIMAVTIFSLQETVERDLSRIRPRALLAAYRTLLRHPYFMLASMVIACAIGAIYALATILPFVLMNQVGLSPTLFGVSQILQAGFYALGAMAVQVALRSLQPNSLIPIGLLLITVSSVIMLVLNVLHDPTFLNIMLPLSGFSFGVAFILPAMLTNTLMPFPHMAGAAAALTAFLQMAVGLATSALASAFSDPALALITLIPAAAAIASLCWLFWRHLPVPPIPTRPMERSLCS